jgi:hypothetical protein
MSQKIFFGDRIWAIPNDDSSFYTGQSEFVGDASSGCAP